MDLPQIRLRTTFIKTGLTIDKPIQEIRQPKAVQHIEQPAAILEIETTPGQLHIDSSQARAEVGSKTDRQRVKEFAEEGYQDWLKGLARRAQQGRELMQIYKKGNPIAAHARENSQLPQRQLNIGWIPSHFSVKLQYDPAQVHIRFKPQQPITEAEIQKPIHQYTPGKVRVDVLIKNTLEIDFANVFPNDIDNEGVN
nr:DUF6470 family protein [uncultured Bacillus sp.]